MVKGKRKKETQQQSPLFKHSPEYYDARAKDEGIRMNPYINTWRTQQVPDQELMDSMVKDGQIEPMVARRLPDGQLELIAGYRRYLAMRALGKKLEEMEITIKENVSDIDAIRISLAENRRRKDLEPIEEARAFYSLKQLGQSMKEIAQSVDRSESYVKDRLDLLELPKEIQEKIQDGKIPMSMAEPLNKLAEFPETQKHLATEIAKGIRDRYGITTVERANQEVTQIKAAIHKKEQLVAKYGPCPKCQSKNIKQEEYGDKDKLICESCGFAWHKETKDPWEVYQIKAHAKKIGMTVDVVGPGEAKMSPQEVTQMVTERVEAIKQVEQPNPKFRSNLTPLQMLKPLIEKDGVDNILKVDIDGDQVTLKLIESSDLHFAAIAKQYRTGEKSSVTVQSGWREGESIKNRLPKVQEYIKSLSQP